MARTKKPFPLVRITPSGYHLPVMEGQPRLPAESSDSARCNDHWMWALVLLVLIAWQGWMTLGFFGPGHSWERLLDKTPIISGWHPFHLYFGFLGADTFYRSGNLSTYDPAFQAGYPKTPVFDSGSRPAELFLALAGGGYHPEAYKLGLAICCCLVPIFFALAGRCLGFTRAGSCLAAALGLLVWWGSPCRTALEAGDLDLLFAGLAALEVAALLLRFDRQPDLWSWFGLLILGWVGWFTQPFIFLTLSPVLLIYYLSVGPRHPLSWHLALLGCVGGAVVGNGFWLDDWVMSWWVRRPVQVVCEELTHRTFHTVWNASLWGDPTDRALYMVLLFLALIGIILLNQTRQRPAARVLGLGSGCFLLLAILGVAWKPLGRLGTAPLLIPALWFAVLPAVHALGKSCQLAGHVTGKPWRGLALGLAVLVGAGGAASPWILPQVVKAGGIEPFDIGLGAERQVFVETLKNHTGAESRILVEDRLGSEQSPRWTVLLPLLTGRTFLGGLDPEGRIEHSFPRLVDGILAGRPIADWSDGDLEGFCRRYNVGWAVCWSPAAVARFHSWSGTRSSFPVMEEGPGFLFTLPHRDYVLKGQAQVVCVDRHRIALANVVPDDGKVVLSQHFQVGMLAYPSRVQIERDPDPDDPIPFIRLRVPGPVACITLTYEDH